jgi:hypothetical protein
MSVNPHHGDGLWKEFLPTSRMIHPTEDSIWLVFRIVIYHSKYLRSALLLNAISVGYSRSLVHVVFFFDDSPWAFVPEAINL